ncbi:peptidoglycan editing factor PgeF [Thalassotalea euphylliae]|uniref:Purine nucleoside phosphorylase n=2 Tax=Thalassotalea euphylliae TaxID=1655234 RepID=A0A3E0U2S1_9GAMM|nr:peptidoglycan editing factor PgeF [Thalassotalea euphylliae]
MVSHKVAVDWPARNVTAFTTTRELAGELSQAGQYDNFNLGLHVGDSPVQVNANRATLAQYLPTNTNIQWLEQVHGSDVAIVEQYQAAPITADAAVTRSLNVALAVMTADCLPILIADKSGQVIAAIHGGWRPLAQNIIAKTVEAMNTPVEQLVAWLGPCIGPTAFEIGGEVKDAFVNLNPATVDAFRVVPESTQKYLANLHQIAKYLLSASGIVEVASLPHCTFSMAQQYYSYRRESVTGRMASVICRNPC